MGIIPIVIIFFGISAFISISMFVSAKIPRNSSHKVAFRAGGAVTAILATVLAGVIYWAIEFSRGLSTFGG